MEDQEWRMRGVVVLVRPDIDYDPLRKQNQVGVVCEANLRLNNIYVDFVDKIGLYSAESLFTLMPIDDIMQDHSHLSVENQKALYKIACFVSYHDANWTFKAMQIARDHPEIQPLCIEILKDQLNRYQAQLYGR